MALAQNTGLHPGQTRPDANDVSNPFTGAPVKSNTFLRIDSADPATGNVRYVRTGTLDPSAVKEFLSKMAERLGGNKNDSQLFNHLFETLIGRRALLHGGIRILRGHYQTWIEDSQANKAGTSKEVARERSLEILRGNKM